MCTEKNFPRINGILDGKKKKLPHYKGCSTSLQVVSYEYTWGSVMAILGCQLKYICN